MNNKILIISYYFPPSAKAGAHRAYSMAKYLPRFGWEPIFIAPERGYYGRIEREDPSLLQDISGCVNYRIPFFYPFNNLKSGFVPRAVRRIWETFLVPDGKVLWNRAIKKSIGEIILRHKPQAVFISGTPFSSFLLAPFIKQEFGLPVVLDYRDPWADNPFESSRIKVTVARELEMRSLSAADLVTTASYHMIDYIRSSYNYTFPESMFFGFPYGYDGKFFQNNILSIPSDEKERIILAFAGSVHGDIEPEIILNGLGQALSYGDLKNKVKIVCYGTLFGKIGDQSELLKNCGLQNHLEVKPFIPYHQLMVALRKSNILILPYGKSSMLKVTYPSKLFDYLGVKRPILYIGIEGQVSETIRACSSGLNVEPDPTEIEEAVVALCEKAHSNDWYPESEAYDRLDRARIFSEFCDRLQSLL
jgi:hypothetical protein